jgi:glyoxylase-like metal-dependent hydrolase (beta-lactamase superfamily II)
MKVIPLSEGSFTIDHTKIFLPFDTAKDDLQERSRGSLLVEIQPFLVETKKDLILLDTGLGFSENGVLQLYNNLAVHGYSPSDITMVLMSHLHRDHAGGITVQDPYSGLSHLSFPHADYFINERELDFALHAGNASYDADRLAILEDNDHVHLIGENGLIKGYIQHELSAGHSPFHQVFWIREENDVVFFGGDEAPQLKQMKTRFVAKYDHDGKKAMELRQKWWEIALEEHWQFLFYHDIMTPVYSDRHVNNV